MGRPKGGRLGDEVRDRVWEALRYGAGVRGAARAGGVAHGTVRVWDLGNGREVAVYRGHADQPDDPTKAVEEAKKVAEAAKKELEPKMKPADEAQKAADAAKAKVEATKKKSEETIKKAAELKAKAEELKKQAG